MSFYQSIAPYYDYIFPPSAMQIAFVKGMMGGICGKKILEAGCGTGNLAMKLAEQKAFIEGIDLDAEMVTAAREKTGDAKNVRFTQMNLLKLSEKWPPNTFDAVVSFGNTLVHLIDREQIRQFFLNAKNVLKPDGLLMVQIIHYDRILDQKIGGLPTIENDEIRFERFYDFNESEEVVDFRTVLTVKKSGEEIRNSVKLLPLRKKQTERLLLECGFKRIRFYGSFKEDNLTFDSVPLIFLAQK